MKILKYFSLLFLLTLVALFVFILTQDGVYKVSKTFVVNAPKEHVFHYIHNTNNWTAWTESRKINDTTFEVQLSDFPYSEIQNNKVYQLDSLTQTLLTKNPANLKWTFKSDGDKTEINFQIEGVANLQSKIMHFLEGNSSQAIHRTIEKDLNKLHATLDQHYDFSEFETLGVTDFKKTTYVYINQNSSLNNLEKDVQEHYAILKSFVTDYKVAADLDPMLLFNSITSKDSITYRLALPIDKKIYLNEDDIVRLDSISTTLTFKTVSTGHYKHLSKALKETQAAFAESKIQQDKQHMTLLRLTNSILDNSNPATWSTEIYIPILAPIQTETIEQSPVEIE